MNRKLYSWSGLAGGLEALPLSAAFFGAFSDSSAASVVWLISTSPAVKALGCSCASAIIPLRIYNSPRVCLLSHH